MALREVTEDFLRVVADSGYSDSVLAEIFETTLQLDELRTAERSPIGRAEEHQHRTTRTHDRLQVSRTTGLVGQVEVGDALPHLGPEPRDVNPLPPLRRRLPPAGGTRPQEGKQPKRCDAE